MLIQTIIQLLLLHKIPQDYLLYNLISEVEYV
jgi:hypothetical protein